MQQIPEGTCIYGFIFESWSKGGKKGWYSPMALVCVHINKGVLFASLTKNKQKQGKVQQPVSSSTARKYGITTLIIKL